MSCEHVSLELRPKTSETVGSKTEIAEDCSKRWGRSMRTDEQQRLRCHYVLSHCRIHHITILCFCIRSAALSNAKHFITIRYHFRLLVFRHLTALLLQDGFWIRPIVALKFSDFFSRPYVRSRLCYSVASVVCL